MDWSLLGGAYRPLHFLITLFMPVSHLHFVMRACFFIMHPDTPPCGGGKKRISHPLMRKIISRIQLAVRAQSHKVSDRAALTLLPDRPPVARDIHASMAAPLTGQCMIVEEGMKLVLQKNSQPCIKGVAYARWRLIVLFGKYAAKLCLHTTGACGGASGAHHRRYQTRARLCLS